MRHCNVIKPLLGRALGAALLLVASAEAQPVKEARLPEAPSATKQTVSEVTNPWVPAPGDAHQDQTEAPDPHDSDREVVAFPRRAGRDQKEIYSAPFQSKNLKWDALFLVATGGLIAVDKRASEAISRGNPGISQDISNIGLYSTVATTGVLCLSGILRNDDHAREAGFLGFEAFGNTLAVEAAMQLIVGRERPLEGAGHGRFWVNNALSSSFPSEHSGLTWSMASVLAHEYPRPWVQFLAYGTATTVSVTRVTGLKHFPADVMVGGFFGYFIGQHIFHAHSHYYPKRHDT